MKSKISILSFLLFGLVLNFSCSKKESQNKLKYSNGESGINYLKDLEGKWIVQGGKEGIFGWKFDLTSRGQVINERLKEGTPTEMMTVYNLEEGVLLANHFCQLQNQPKLIAVESEIEGDLHFLCDGQVGNTKSHDELHMHGVHFLKRDSNLTIWMDMYKDGRIDFETRYELYRIDSEKGKELDSWAKL